MSGDLESVADPTLRRRVGSGARSIFAALSIPNYRLYFVGQVVSVSGTWMQNVAQAWLVLKLTKGLADSSLLLGLVTAVQFVPMLVAGPWGGVVADRFNKRKVLVGTQLSAGLLAGVLAVLTLGGFVKLWEVFLLSFLLGCVNMIDVPTRQAFVLEMVDRQTLPNAVSLNSVVMQASRVMGPALAGVLIETLGTGWCFAVNSVSYIAVIGALVAMDVDKLDRKPAEGRAKGQLKAGLQYVWSNRSLKVPIMMMAVVGTLSYETQVVLPLMDRYAFHQGAGTLGALYAFMGAGAVAGGLMAARRRKKPAPKALASASLLFGLFMLLVSGSPSLVMAYVFLLPMGAASVSFVVFANSTLQLTADPAMRGRVMALYAVAFLGSTPVGALIVGAVANVAGARASMAVGGVAALATGLWRLDDIRRTRMRDGGQPQVSTAAE